MLDPIIHRGVLPDEGGPSVSGGMITTFQPPPSSAAQGGDRKEVTAGDNYDHDPKPLRVQPGALGQAPDDPDGVDLHRLQLPAPPGHDPRPQDGARVEAGAGAADH